MNKELILNQVETNVKNCRKCRLCETATNSVPGEGNIDAKIVFIGEAPGANEDATGRPFVGRAGKLLDALLHSINLVREDVWIGNIIKHRPPQNRAPMPDEIKACEPYLSLQIEAIKPELIVTLGRFALNYFYKEGKISRDRGNLVNIGHYHVYPVYHPAAGLRNPTMLDALKKDFIKIPKILEQISSNKLSNSTNFIDEGQLTLFKI